MATDRLRRKVRSVSPDSLWSLTRNLCIVGTPLPSVSSGKRDPNELKPIWQQEARDAQGRRRFHGAFTGGWSAGYYNTVGSEHGWTPTSFRSSRKHRAEDKRSTVQDFMDEEDLADWKAAQHVTRASDNAVAGLNQIAGLREVSASTSAVAEEDGVGLASNEEVGYKLLRRMGWKPGQELGCKSGAKTKAMHSDSSRTIGSGCAIKVNNSAHVSAQAHTSKRGLGAPEQPTLLQMLDKHDRPKCATTTSVDSPKDDRAHVWSDGRPILSGFQLARQASAPPRVLERPPLPVGWQPDPTRIWKRSTASTDDPARNLTPASRAHLLGEAKLPGPPPNIAAFLSTKARQHLASSRNLPLPSPCSSESKPEFIHVPHLDPSTAAQALQGFAPFDTNPAKHERYLTYLKSQSTSCSTDERSKSLAVPTELTAEQYSNELHEFAKSANMFRPISSAMASRFAKASESVMQHETSATSAHAGLRHPAPASAVSERKDKERQNEAGVVAEKQLSIAQSAAKMGNFGHLTRKVEAWEPERLLCKRLGVTEPAIARRRKDGEQPTRSQHSSVERPDPNMQDDPDLFYGSTRSSKSKSSVRVDQHWARSKDQLKALAAAPTPLSLDAQASTGLFVPQATTQVEDALQEDEIGMGDDERQGDDTLTYIKPSIDVYKAIFASDEETSDVEQGGASRDKTAMRPKMHDSTAGSGVIFQVRSKRKDAGDETEKLADTSTSTAAQTEKKRKKDKSTKKRSLLTFDFDQDDLDAAPVGFSSETKTKTKARMRASDMF